MSRDFLKNTQATPRRGLKERKHMNTEQMYLDLGISREVYAFGEKILASLEERFKEIDRISEYN